MDTTKLLELKVAGPKDRARISEVTSNFVILDEAAESWNGFSNTGTVKAEGTDFAITPVLKIATDLFSLTVKMPRTFAEDDTITVDGVAYTLYQGSDPADSEAFKAGEVVTLNFDKTARRCWAGGGGGVPKPLPAQISNLKGVAVEGETPKIDWTWTNPTDENFAGMVLVVKEGSSPNGPTDGVQVYKGSSTTVTQTDGLQFERTYYARGFAYNSQNKYQMDATGAIASATPSNIPDQVSNVELVGNKGSATLTWTNPTNLSYSVTKVIQKIESDPESPTDGTEVYSGTGTTATVNNLQDGINYHFGIFAMSENGQYKPPVTKTYTPQIWPKYDYTGNHTLLKDNAEQGLWRIKFLSSGVLTWLNEDTQIDVFLVGGGAPGSYRAVYSTGGDFMGGAGGYTKTVKNQNIEKSQRINVKIGAGGVQPNNTNTVVSGGTSSFDQLSVSGATLYNGGSGGGAGSWDYSTAGNGGSDGSNGGNGNYRGTTVRGGSGQGTTTREFGEPGGDLYSGGGGGGNHDGSGGSGGSGSPKLATNGTTVSNGSYSGGSAGGGYGGGGGGSADPRSPQGRGAQGIVIIRNART